MHELREKTVDLAICQYNSAAALFFAKLRRTL
jgi:hypothetical protein